MCFAFAAVPRCPGAAQLVVRAAQRGGAGLVTLAVMQTELFDRVAPFTPETIYLDVSRTKDLYAGRLPREIAGYHSHVRVVGPGLNASGRTRELVRRLVEDDFGGPLVLDADALNVLAGAPELLTLSESQVVLTPHPREAQKLLEREIPKEPEGRTNCAGGIGPALGFDLRFEGLGHGGDRWPSGVCQRFGRTGHGHRWSWGCVGRIGGSLCGLECEGAGQPIRFV